MRVLLIEDDTKIASVLKQGFKEECHDVQTVPSGEEGLYLVTKNSYDVIVLDWMLPQMDGIEVCKTLRAQQIITPILLLTARSDIEDRVLGLNSGADDYLSKPFSFDELLARVNALVRRNTYQFSHTITIDNLVFDTEKREVIRGGEMIELTSKEYDILELLIKNRGHTVTLEKIAYKLWGTEAIESNVINVFVHHLRVKIDKNGQKKLIKTVRKLGYKINDD